MSLPDEGISFVGDESKQKRELAFQPLSLVEFPVELLECMQCSALVRGDRAGHHVDWHFEAGKKVDQAGSPFPMMGFGAPKAL